ncbi:MAG: type IV pilus assembly protein PilM [Planctomycetes bacterium]|nr:type IV pilus assembly protein PilM [Planctomycetota bacterium]
MLKLKKPNTPTKEGLQNILAGITKGVKTVYEILHNTIVGLVGKGETTQRGLSLRDLDWRKLFTMRKHQVLGLDIGSSAVRIVQLNKDDNGYIVTVAAMVDVAPTKDKNGEGINTTKAINECLELTGAQTKWAVCSVCGSETAVRYFEFPTLPNEEIPSAVMLEAEQVCPFTIDDSAVDYQLIPTNEDTVSGVLVAATDKLLRNKRQFVQNTSLENVLMDIDGLALLNCFTEFEKPHPNQTIAILNVGSSYATLAIMSDDTLPFVRDTAYAGNDIIEHIANEKNIPEETVKAMLAGRETENETHYELDDSLKRACRKSFIDVTEALRYYAAQENSTAVEKLFVCGGFAMTKGFMELLNEHLSIDVVLWNPFEKIRTELSPSSENLLKENGPAMAVVAGLAMRSV